MASKRIKQKMTAVETPADKARALWLAGLGAVSIAQKRGGELGANLIAEGKDFQARAQQLVQEVGTDAQAQIKGAFAPLRMQAKDNAKKFGVVIEGAVAAVLAHLGIPSKADIEELTQRMTALSRQLKTVK
jgi:poly(hydroxyalkanoate) granule-associated protein